MSKVNLEEILKSNPSVSRKELKEIASLSDKLRELGVEPRGYELALPFARHHFNANISKKTNSQTINSGS